MKLISFRIRDYKSTRDSNPIPVGEVTCLVGKNESGKTSLLQALYKLNPLVPNDAEYDVVGEYPRADVEDYRQAIEAGQRASATVVEATFELEPPETNAIESEFGPGTIPDGRLIASKAYGSNEVKFDLITDEKAAGQSVVARAGMEAEIRQSDWNSLQELATAWESVSKEKARSFKDATAKAASVADPDEKKAAESSSRQLEETARSKEGRNLVAKVASQGLGAHLCGTFLKGKLPKFLYFDEFYQMEGHVNIEALKDRQAKKSLVKADHPMLALIELARLRLDDLIAPRRTEELLSKLEGASNHLSKQLLKYWSQNKHLSVRFDVRPARPEDPPGMTSGTNLLGRVYDSVHLVSTPLGSRSKGFVWFFSFIAWFSEQQKLGEPLILLLDEPGLVLHATAQADLLEFIEEQLKPGHQVIYTTHSPFMVDAARFDRVRIVEDKSMDAAEPLPAGEAGTKVYTDVLEATQGSLFPLQGALGYELSQTLFVGANSLIVEGASDLLYLQIMSAVLEREKRTALSREWTITPVGGAEKVSTFAALLGAQNGLRVAALIDFQERDRQKIENLYKRKLLNQKNVLTFATFAEKPEADIEDMFEPAFYLELVSGEFKASLSKSIGPGDLTTAEPRILVQLDRYLGEHPLNDEVFNHYRPARYLSENLQTMQQKISEATLRRFELAFGALNKLIGR